MSKYIVIYVRERDSYNIGVADTLMEATKIMQNNFMKIFEDEGIDIDDFEFNVPYDNCCCGLTCAWLNGRYNYDWNIIEVEV